MSSDSKKTVKVNKKEIKVNDKKDEKKVYKITFKDDARFEKGEKDEAGKVKVDWIVIKDKEGKDVKAEDATEKGTDLELDVKLDKGWFWDGIKFDKIGSTAELKKEGKAGGPFKATFYIVGVVIILLFVALIWWWIASSRKEDREEGDL